MRSPYKILVAASLVLLLFSLVFGILSILSFLNIPFVAKWLPFQQARPVHVSSALFWIITAAVAGIMYYNEGSHPLSKKIADWKIAFVIIWLMGILAIFTSYFMGYFGGREYWEFPPQLNLLLLVAWLLLLAGFYMDVIRKLKDKPAYIWMWFTGILFFFFTFSEQQLWQIPWFRNSFLKEMTVQWKSNGSMVGAWNQMVYGTAIYLMVKISGDESIAHSKKAYFSYFLGLTNLIFNWGHHIYNIPTASWIRDVAYGITMTEWILVLSIIQGFRKKLKERERLRHLLTYKLLIAAEFWVFLNLLLALLMSIPAINIYTHGTHITVAHAMGTTIGINSMILLASLTYMFHFDDRSSTRSRKYFSIGYWVTQFSLMVFWVSLIVAGLIKGINTVSSPSAAFADVMQRVYPVLKKFMFSGIFLLVGMGLIAVLLLSAIKNLSKQDQ